MSLISVIVPVFNAEYTLRRCIDSIMAQNFNDYELILVDDGSSDKSPQICNSYAEIDSRIKVIHKQNGGVSSARNAGLDVAKGEFIAFADSDDEMGPKWLSDLISNIGNADICVAGITRVRNNIASSASPIQQPNIEALITHLVSLTLFGYPVTKLYRRSIIEKANLRFDTTLKWREDDVFNAQYFETINTFAVSESAEYVYYLPDANKNYGGTNSTRCAIPLFQSYFRIFDGNIPSELCRLQSWTIKGETERLMLKGELPSKDLLNIYKYVFCQVLKKERGIKDKLKDSLIIHSHKLGRISTHIMKFIHKLT